MSAWWTTPLVVGHRGGRGAGWPPENTLPAFEQARRQGARAIELDVRPCAGGTVVVFHDETLARMTGHRDERRVADVRSDDLLAIDLGGATVPTIDEVLAWARAAGVAVNVEMKHGVSNRRAFVRATVDAVQASRADVLFSSFDPAVLAIAGVLAPSIPRAFLTEARAPAWARILEEAARRPVVQGLNLERIAASADRVARYRRRGLRVAAWTVNDAAEARELVRLGVASIITDQPGAILAAL
ncbi:MAG TPA: glycerophosphodiester phosphodiesterase [Polyangiaceae bacterium]|jgi:glycerophosphoryl diester phosphodiesterase|nr:glycerophosphodiester phosphodiesterase [Polyangiaceae bacterium]